MISPALRGVRAFAVAAAFIAVAAAPGRDPVRWAVIVGINDYENFTEEDGGDLLGAVNDALAMQEVLIARHGFQERNIRLLLDGAATRDAIEAALTRWLPERVRSGDLVVFYFAGHGSLTFDLDGDEPDGVDQTICPVDALRYSSERDIVDDDLGRWLNALPTDQVVAILDSCHSGSATRAAGVRARSLPRPALAGAPASRSLGAAAAALARAEISRFAEGSNVLEIASASRHQPAMDAVFRNPDGTEYYGGAFTTHLVRRLWQAPPGATYRELFLNTVASVKGDRFTQDPQITGHVDRPIFRPGALATDRATAAAGQPSSPDAQPGGTSVRARSDLLGEGGSVGGDIVVHQVLGRTVSLNAGVNRGLTAGSQVQLTSGATIRIEEVARATSQGTVTAGAARPYDTGRLVRGALASRTLRVDVANLTPALRAAVSRHVADEPDIVMDSSAVAADLIVSAASVPGAVDLLNRDGAFRMRVYGANDAELGSALARRLRHELGIQRLTVMESPMGSFDLVMEVADGRHDFRVGDEIEFRIRTQRGGYLTLLDLGTDGGLTVLYPNSYMQIGRLRPGQEIVVPGGGAVFTMVPPQGNGVVRAIVTDEPLFPADSRDWAEPDGAAFAARVRQRLESTLSGGTAGSTPSAWGTALVVYSVRER
jgi:hypothetical protein